MDDEVPEANNGRINVRETNMLDVRFTQNGTPAVPGIERFLDRAGVDAAILLLDLDATFGPHSYSILMGYGGMEAAAEWSEEEKLQILLQTMRDCIPPSAGQIDRSISAMDLECLGAPTREQLRLVIQRLLYVAGGFQGRCPVEAARAAQAIPQGIATDIESALALAYEGQAEEHLGKLKEAHKKIAGSRLAAVLYAAKASNNSRDDVYSKLVFTEEEVRGVAEALTLTIKGLRDSETAAAPPVVNAAIRSTTAGTDQSAAEADDACLTAMIRSRKFVLNDEALPGQLRVIGGSIQSKKSGMVYINAIDDSTTCFDGVSVRAVTEEVATAAVRQHNLDLSRHASLKHMIGLLAFHPRSVTLRPWGRLQHLEQRDFNQPELYKLQDTGSGKVNTPVGVSAVYEQISSVSEVADGLRNISDALSLGFENSHLLHVESLKTVACFLEQQDNSVGGRLPVTAIALAVQGDLQEWVGATKRGEGRPFKLSEETTSVLKRHVDHGLTRLEENPSLRFATSNKRALTSQTAPDEESHKKKKKKKVKQANQQAILVGEQDSFCYVCGATDHTLNHCPKKIPKQRQGGVSCWRCGGNHRMTACPVPRGQAPGPDARATLAITDESE
jgi:hypothetical protein